MKNNLPSVIIEKRRHKLYVTRNTEYHMRDDVCVAIRKRCSGDWLMHGSALGARLIGTIVPAYRKNRKVTPFLFPELGDNLVFFSSTGRDIVTTKLRAVKRPPETALKYYLEIA